MGDQGERVMDLTPLNSQFLEQTGFKHPVLFYILSSFFLSPQRLRSRFSAGLLVMESSWFALLKDHLLVVVPSTQVGVLGVPKLADLRPQS